MTHQSVADEDSVSATTHTVTVNYGLSLAEMIKAGRYD